MQRAGNEKLGNVLINIPVKAETEIYEATMVAINSAGYAVTATKASGLIIAGCAQRYTDNRIGGNGDITVPVSRKCYVWNNDGTIKATDLLKDCYVADSETVSITAEGSSKAGKILAVDDDGVTVDMSV